MITRTALAAWTALLVVSFALGALLPIVAKADAAYGTAFAVTQDGVVVTNEHVVSGCTSIDAGLGAGAFAGEVTAHDERDDLAIVHLSAKTPNFAVLRKLPPLRVGDSAFTYGFPLPIALASEGNLTTGSVSALRGPGDSQNYVQITTPIQPGNSGGALLDTSGHVIGVVAKRLVPVGPKLVNLAISLGALRNFLSTSKIPTTEQDSSQVIRPDDIGNKARLFSYLIRCVRSGAILTNVLPIEAPSGSPPSPGPESAVLYEEDRTNPQGRRFLGSVTWRLESSPPEGGHSQAPRIRGDIRIPERINAVIVMEQSSQINGSARYQIEITFNKTKSPEEDVAAVAGILAKVDETTKGVPIVADPVRTGANSFDLKLTDHDGYKQQNLILLRERPWLDIPILYKDGRRGILAVAKGTSGLRVFGEAIGNWGWLR